MRPEAEGMTDNPHRTTPWKVFYGFAGMAIVLASFVENGLLFTAYRRFVDPYACLSCGGAMGGATFHEYPAWLLIPALGIVITSFWVAWRFVWKPHLE